MQTKIKKFNRNQVTSSSIHRNHISIIRVLLNRFRAQPTRILRSLLQTQNPSSHHTSPKLLRRPHRNRLNRNRIQTLNSQLRTLSHLRSIITRPSKSRNHTLTTTNTDTNKQHHTQRMLTNRSTLNSKQPRSLASPRIVTNQRSLKLSSSPRRKMLQLIQSRKQRPITTGSLHYHHSLLNTPLQSPRMRSTTLARRIIRNIRNLLRQNFIIRTINLM